MSTLDQNPASPDGAGTPEQAERRHWPRYPDVDRSRVWYSTPVQGAQQGQLDEISLGGLSIRVPDASQLPVEARIVVGVGEWMIPATVKHIQPDSKSGFRVGMEWVRSGSAAVAGLVNHYRGAAVAPHTAVLEAPTDEGAGLAEKGNTLSSVAAE